MILVIAATNRPQSLSQVVAKYYTSHLQSIGISSQLISLTQLPADFTQTALYAYKGKNTLFNQLANLIPNYKKLVFVVPEYNGSFPGVLKAFIDGLDSKVFKGKKCALVGVSKGAQGGIIALSHLTDIFHYLQMNVYPIKLKLSNIQTPSLDSVKEHPGYLDKLHLQAQGFIHF